MNSFQQFTELDFKPYETSDRFNENSLRNPVLPHIYSRLYFKIGLIMDDGELRSKFYHHIGQFHNSIMSPLLSLFEIKIFFQQSLNQLVFFNPEFWKWRNKGDPSARLSINHLRGTHALLIILDLDNFTESLNSYINNLLINNKSILHNGGQIPIFVLGCYNSFDHPEIDINKTSFSALQKIIPADMKVIFTKVDLDRIIGLNQFQLFETFLFTEIYKELYFSLNENTISGLPRLIWNTHFSNLYQNSKEYIPKDNLKVEVENFRCIAHGGFITGRADNSGNSYLQCSICRGFYCKNCFEIYQVSEICFGSLLTYKHKVVLEDS